MYGRQQLQMPFRADSQTVKRGLRPTRMVGDPQLPGASMWALIKWLVMKLAVVRWIMKVLSMIAFLPIAFLLKAVGLPVLIVLAVLALPVLFLLFLFGLPIFLVLLVGGLAMGALFVALSIGMMALKFAIFVVLPIWLGYKLISWLFRGRGGGVARPDVQGPDSTSGADAA
jgi:hypothetical protein